LLEEEMKMNNIYFLVLGVMAAACASEPIKFDGGGTEPIQEPQCEDPPEIDLEEVEGSQPSSADVVVSTYVYLEEECENVSLVGVKLYYQQSTAGSDSWEEDSMVPGQNPDEWRGTIPSFALGSAYMRYYVSASDSAGNVSVVPEGADNDTLKASIFNISTQ
jgi:hypothetical protein